MHTYMIDASIQDAGATSGPLFFSIGAVAQAYRPLEAGRWQVRSRLSAEEISRRLGEWLGGSARLEVREIDGAAGDGKGWLKGHLNSTRLALYHALQKL